MSMMQQRGRSSSRRRTRCKCAGGGGDRATPCCFNNPLKSLFRCPGRGRGRSRSSHSRSRSRHQQTPSRVRDAPVTGGAELQSEEPSFFLYSMPNQGGPADHKKKKNKKKHLKKPHLPSIRSCFRRKKKERNTNAGVMNSRRQPLTPAPSMVTHAPNSPSPDKTQGGVTPSMTQPPSPAVTENGCVNSPAPPPDRRPATPRTGKQSTSSAQSTFPPQWQSNSKQTVEGLEIVELATGDRLSAHDMALIEMVGSSTNGSSESSMKSSLEYINEPQPTPPTPTPAAAKSKRTVVEREATVVKAVEPPRLWLNGNGAATAKAAGARFTGSLVVGEADELWAHDIASSRAHAAMLAETVSFLGWLSMPLDDKYD